MDFLSADKKTLAPQLRKPEGEYGRWAGKIMAGKNNEVTAFTLESIGIDPTDHVLDIGFGPGEGIAQLVQLTPDGFVAGIDFSDAMLEMAEERNHRALMQEHVELTLGEAKDMPYDDESFYKVLAVNVFHFWVDPQPELAECMRVLRLGGRIAFFMAYPSSWLPGLKETGVFIAREPQDVEQELQKAGFTHVTHKPFTLHTYRGFVAMGEKA